MKFIPLATINTSAESNESPKEILSRSTGVNKLYFNKKNENKATNTELQINIVEMVALIM